MLIYFDFWYIEPDENNYYDLIIVNKYLNN